MPCLWNISGQWLYRKYFPLLGTSIYNVGASILVDSFVFPSGYVKLYYALHIHEAYIGIYRYGNNVLSLEQ